MTDAKGKGGLATWSRRVAASTALVAGCVLVGQGTANAASSLVTVTWGSWKQCSQQESNWCWAAGAKMIVQKVQGTSPSECTLVKYGKGASACGNVTGTMNEMAGAIYTAGVTTYGTYTGKVPYSTVRARTLDGGGVLTRVAWTGGGTVGHIAPLIGSATSPDRVYITYIRDGSVSGSWITYTQFAAGTAGLGTSTYTPTHYLYR